MASVAIIYFSGSGHTQQMAEAVADGARQVSGTTVQVLRVTGEQISNGRWQDDAVMETLNQADAIVFGSPTYMGGVAAQFKAFLDAGSAAWFSQQWKDKLAGGFTHSSSPSGDKQGTLIYLSIYAAQQGMVWIGPSDLPSAYFGKDDGVNRLGSFLGVMGQSPLKTDGSDAEVDSGDRLTAEKYGYRLAEAAHRWSKQLVAS
ncbi:MAG: flavodoxin family protein [Kaiparowitsia implicata GSE-PSE-MK54-09C]|jgi:NAD(P)H dehydrogenase (quinone)|nr:flavodoxin family protein [Kaiparowitsia implicata GSE-PSE-MK54-09C]